MIIEATPLIGIPEKIEAMGLLETLKKAVNMPVFMENDVKAAAMGEYRIHGKEKKDMIFISLGTGVGAGIILDGTLRKGPRNMAEEIGYLSMDIQCTNRIDQAGWLEQNANLAALGNIMGKAPEQFDPNMEADRSAMEKISGHVALAAANLCNSLDVDTVILGGVLVELLGEPFVQRIREQVSRLTLMQAELSNYALMQPGVAGAAMIVMDRMLDTLLAE
jgi:predicted NBD/HSP70 family sugar kinase